MSNESNIVCLVFPPHMRIDAYYVTPPLGLLLLGASLEKRGFNVVVKDLIFEMRRGNLKSDTHIYDNSVKEIMKCNPRIVGISTQCVTYPTCINIAKRIKQIDPTIKIIFGGHNSSFLDEDTLRKFQCVDAVARGEGEVVMPNLIDALLNNKDLAPIKGITYRHNNEIIRNEDEELIQNLDELPFPAYHLVNSMEEYKALGETMTILIESGRGCVFNCIFCSNCNLWHRKVRYKSIKRVIEEIKQLEEFHPDEYYLVHDFFTFNEDYVREFCRELKKNNLNIKWNCRCRLNVSVETLKAMKDAGCERLLYGVESGSEKVLKIMKKNIKFDHVYDSIRKTIESGIIPSLSFVVGVPGEELEDLSKTLHLILMAQMVGNCYPFMQILSPLPGTFVSENYSKDLYLWKGNAFSRGIEYDDGIRLKEDMDLILQYPQMFCSFYNVKSDVEIDYLNEISKVYCVIIEMFSYAYYAYCMKKGLTEIELYNIWREWARTEGIENIENMSKRDIWECFDKFMMKKFDLDIEMHNLIKYIHVRYIIQIENKENFKMQEEFDIDMMALMKHFQEHKYEEYQLSSEKTVLLLIKDGYNIKTYQKKVKD